MKVVRILKQPMLSVHNLRITILVEDSVSMNKPEVTAKHGLSLLVETNVEGVSSKILMDAGPPSDIALRNADVINVDLQTTATIVLSHGHYDHTGGLINILKRINQTIPVVAHPKVFSPKFALRPTLKFIGTGFDPSSVTEASGRLLLAENSVSIMNGVMTSGEIARESIFEKTEGFWTVEDDRFVEDNLVDDQALLINVMDRGLAVLTGCAHSGIINTLRHAQKITGINKVCAVVGGFHLDKADNERIVATIDELVKINPTSIYPCHCTGSKATRKLLDSFGDRCKPVQTGDSIEL